mmetsp:Transcript_65522/g.213350  ORF Transcript_65522/g.213350 Transcript_65522/m.213350 type:complete len:114 (+) Transcript_65522:191-532(+)
MTADRALYNHSKPQTVKSTRPTTFASIFASKRCLRLSRKALKPGASCSFMRSIGLPFNHSSDKLPGCAATGRGDPSASLQLYEEAVGQRRQKVVGGIQILELYQLSQARRKLQ